MLAPPGVTAVSGRVLTLDGRPLPDVTLRIGEEHARTDRTGRFLLVPSAIAGGRHVLEIDGASASGRGRKYGFFEYGMVVAAGQTTVLPFTIWMPRLDTRHVVRIGYPTTREMVVTTPYIPGLELHVPRNTGIQGKDGKPVTELSITPIPVDRPPFPLARNVDVPVYFTVQPGGARLGAYGSGAHGAWLVYPNFRDGQPGQRVQFFHYDPAERDWHVYGLGTVAAGGRQVHPDATTRIYQLTGAMINTGDSPPAGGPTPEGPTWGDPVDPSIGIFTMQKTDLYVPDVIPVALTRSYNSGDTLLRRFGRGMTYPYEMLLWSADQYEEADLILPEGGRIHFVRTSPGTGFADATFVHKAEGATSATSTAFHRATMAWNGNSWDVRLRDGTVYVFGENAPLQAIRDRYGNTVAIARSGPGQMGRVTRVTSPNGRWIAFTYGANNRVSQVTDTIGRTVTYTYDGNGNLSTVTDPESNVTTYTYDASNRMASIRDGRNIVFVSNTYTNGRVTHQTLADPAHTYQFAYTVNGAGKVTQTDVTDPRGHVTRLAFNADGYLLSQVEALGTAVERTTTYQRQAGSNLMTSITDGLSRRTDFTYDSSGRVLTETRLAGTVNAVTTTYTYEPAFGQLATVTDPLSHTWTVSYDSAGKITGTSDPLSHAGSVVMNAVGRVTSATDPLTHTWQFGYAGPDLTTTTNPLGQVRTRFVDAVGRVLTTADPLGRMTATAYDGLNRVTSMTDPGGGQTSFTYDANGNLLSLTDAQSHTTTYTYDVNDRTATRTDPLTRAESYLYDGNGNVVQHTDRKSQVTAWTYDALDRLTLVTYDDASTTAYTYDAGDRLTQVVDSIAGTITRTYDGLDRLTSETTPEGSVSYTYDADGRRATMTVAGQPVVSYGYDAAHRLTSITQGTAVVSFTYDDADRRSTLTYANGIVATYGYDAADRLTSLTNALGGTPLGTLTYTYDAAGNRTAVGGTWARTGLPAAVASATYDAANQIATWGGTAFTYDANGNLTNDGAKTYAWNARNQLAGLSGGVSASFAYDGMERRRSKTISGLTTKFLYDTRNTVQELSAGGTATANLLIGLGIDEVFRRTDAAGPRELLTDVLGSTLELADASGTLHTHYTFEPFGATTTTGASSTNWAQFTGRENDGTSLYAYRARFYSPTLQRFMSEDPVGFAAGEVNLHTYVANQPTMWRDPSGLIKLSLPPGHPCAWPSNDGSKSRSSDVPSAEPPLSWWLQCSPTVVPDLFPTPPVRRGHDGWPRLRIGWDPPGTHTFPWGGQPPHIQIDIWWDGVPGSTMTLPRIPVPWYPWK